VAPFPADPARKVTLATTDGFGIYAGTRYPEAAWEQIYTLGQAPAEIQAVQKTAQQVAQAMHLSATGLRAKAEAARSHRRRNRAIASATPRATSGGIPSRAWGWKRRSTGSLA